MPYTHILAPTDFSALANHAVSHAFQEAVHHQAKLTLLHVLHHLDTEVYYIKGSPEDRRGFVAPFGGILPSQQASAPETVRRDHLEETLTQLRDLVPHSFTGMWDVDVSNGHPADVIVRVAQEREVDLIIMGTRGRTGLPHVLLGSVAEKVVRLAPCPVLVMHNP